MHYATPNQTVIPAVYGAGPASRSSPTAGPATQATPWASARSSTRCGTSWASPAG